MKRVLQIIPQHSNGPCGIEDYAGGLAAVWRENQNIEVRVLPLYVGSGQAEDPAQVLSEFQPHQVLIHFEAYGFARSAPVKQTVASILQAIPPDTRVVVFFHELHVEARPWQRAFLLSRRQRLAAQMLAAAAEVVATSNETFAGRLKLWPTHAHVLPPLPVPSNIGEAAALTTWQARRNELVVFGGAAKRAALYRHRNVLVEAIRHLGIEHVIDIGPEQPRPLRFPDDIHVDVRGVRPALEIQECLLASRFGALCLPGQWLAKSGIFAAYAAHGVVPVVFDSQQDGYDGLFAGRQFVSGADLLADPEGYAAVSNATSNWYHSHQLNVHAEMLLV